MDTEVTIWDCDTHRTLAGTVDISLIMIEVKIAAPRRGPRVELNPLNENLANKVKFFKGLSRLLQRKFIPPQLTQFMTSLEKLVSCCHYHIYNTRPIGADLGVRGPNGNLVS